MRDRPGAIAVRYGSRRAVVAAIARCQPARIAWLATGTASLSAWQGLRQLLGFAASALAAPAFADLCGRHRPVLALIAPESAAALRTDERAIADALRADLRVHDTHSLASGQPLIAAAAALIADALAATGADLAVPELALLDPETGRALIEAFRSHAGLADLHLGHDPDRAAMPEQAWGVAVQGQLAPVRGQLADVRLDPRTTVAWLVDADAPSAPFAEPAAPLGPDAVARAALTAPGTPSDATLAAGLAALRWTSEVRAAGAALALGLLLERHHVRLGPTARAEHAWLTAVAATNAHFVDRATPGFDEQLYAMYDRALALARDPCARASLAVRLAFAGVERDAVRADGDLVRAAACVAALAPGPWPTYYAAQLAIAEALHQLHQGELAAAERLAAAASTGLAELVHVVRGAWPAPQADRVAHEAAGACFMIAAHLALETAERAPALAARWHARAEAERARVSAAARFEVLHWVSLRHDDDWAVLAARARDGLDEAERHWDARTWTLYRAVAAACAYRLGRAAEAHDHAQRHAAALAARLPDPSPLWTGDLRSLTQWAALRAGDHAAAVAVAERWATVDEPAPAEVLAVAAWAHAARGDAGRARAALEHAIDRAVDGGHQATMLRVATHAAHVLALLDESDEARAARDRAWELAEDAPGQFSRAAPPADCLRLCVTEARATPPSRALIVRACALVPACVYDAEAWWDIPPLLAAIAGWQACGEPWPDELRAALAIVGRLAPQRADWRAALAALAPEPARGAIG